jgi:hypothetical protein
VHYIMDCKLSDDYWSDERRIIASSDRAAIAEAKQASASQNLTPFRVRAVHRSDEQIIYDSRKDISGSRAALQATNAPPT